MTLTLLIPNIKILDWSNLNTFANDTKYVSEKSKFVKLSGRVENIMGKGEIAGYQHFLIFPQCFQKARGQQKVELCGK